MKRLALPLPFIYFFCIVVFIFTCSDEAKGLNTIKAQMAA